MNARLFSFLFLVMLLPLKAGGGEKAVLGTYPLNDILSHHLMDSVIWEWNIGGKKIYEGEKGFEKTTFVREYLFQDKEGRLYKYQGGLPMHITRRAMQIFILSAILVFFLIFLARKIAKNPYRISGRIANMLETLFEWCRKEIVDPNIHSHAKAFYSYFATLFFFILLLNLGGLLPPMGEALHKLYGDHEGGHSNLESPWVAIWPGMTATGDFSVTLTLALITTFMIWFTGFRYQGFSYFWRVVPNGVPAPLYIIMWPLEFLISPLAKGFALTIRLLANMTAGHVIILALLGFIFQSATLWFGGTGGIITALGINFSALLGTIAIYFLELMVAFLQAFIFTLLSSLFIGSAIHRH